MISLHHLNTLGLSLMALHAVGLLHALHAILYVRTSQGAIAWAISLATFPGLAVPLYWVFGRSRFHGYVKARRLGNLEINHIAWDVLNRVAEFRPVLDNTEHQSLVAFERLAKLPCTKGNDIRLLVDGPAAFDAMFEAIGRAKRYIVLQFFIVHDDELGRELKRRLLEKAGQGVKVFFLYDGVGSHALPPSYISELRSAGVEMKPFRAKIGRKNRFQINFRNHRKITIVDGREAYVGGLNVGDEYMGRNPRFGPWRDTHVRIEGPAVQCLQVAFLEDWYWAVRQVPDLEWVPQAASREDRALLALPTGPADDVETCSLFFVHAINAACRRIWITSPYFVPDSAVQEALQLAVLRGVDVRILLPLKPDHVFVYLCAFWYVERMRRAGVKLYRYVPGFMHQKVMLIDDLAASVGTANLDNRSFRLNFELTVLALDKSFAADVERMLEHDFARAQEVVADELEQRPAWFRLAASIARLLSPIQ